MSKGLKNIFARIGEKVSDKSQSETNKQQRVSHSMGSDAGAPVFEVCTWKLFLLALLWAATDASMSCHQE